MITERVKAEDGINTFGFMILHSLRVKKKKIKIERECFSNGKKSVQTEKQQKLLLVECARGIPNKFKTK